MYTYPAESTHLFLDLESKNHYVWKVQEVSETVASPSLDHHSQSEAHLQPRYNGRVLPYLSHWGDPCKSRWSTIDDSGLHHMVALITGAVPDTVFLL